MSFFSPENKRRSTWHKISKAKTKEIDHLTFLMKCRDRTGQFQGQFLGHFMALLLGLGIKRKSIDNANFFAQSFSPPFLVACYATLHPALSVRPSVGWSVGQSPFYFFYSFYSYQVILSQLSDFKLN